MPPTRPTLPAPCQSTAGRAHSALPPATTDRSTVLGVTIPVRAAAGAVAPEPDNRSPLPPLVMAGASGGAPPTPLVKLRGSFANQSAVLLIDSGASGEFIDPSFAARCGLALTPSDRTVRLADGTLVRALGQTTATCRLAPVKGTPVDFSATFTATPLSGYDAILGVTWLATHNVDIGWADRTVILRSPGLPPRAVRTIDDPDNSSVHTLATISMRHLRRAMRRDVVEELYAVRIDPVPESPVLAPATDHPRMLQLLREYADVFPEKLPSTLPPERGVEHSIQLKPGAIPPPVRPLYHQSSKDSAVIQQYVEEGLASGMLQRSTSPYGAMVIIVRKKDGTHRVVIDYRGLNDITVKNRYPLPLTDELFDKVHGAQWFTKIDLRTGFHQILLKPEDTHKTAFRTRFGSYEYRVLPMGLCNAPGTFMELMNNTFADLLDRCVLAFLDDILVYSRTEQEHVQHVEAVLQRLRSQRLYAKLSKCSFFERQVEFLGHTIGADGLSVSPDKIAAVRDWPRPKNVREVRSFLGLANFYRRFVKDYALVALPLTELTKEKVQFTWGRDQQQSFEALKRALCSTPILLIPDPSLSFVLNCDACQYAIGATLQQDQGRGLQPVAYYSHKLSGAELNWDTREKEFFALVAACQHWRHYLHSEQPFTLLTDHDSLKYHRTMPKLSGKLARWIEKMAEFDYTIQHIPGVKNVVADALSRRADLQPAAPAPHTPQQLAAADAHSAEEQQRERHKAAAEQCCDPDPNLPAPNRDGAIVMPTQRCTANTKAGNHCRQRTARGQYCWNHLRSISGLRIKRSTVAGAGMGLFASRDLPARTRIDYTGDRRVDLTEQDGGAYFLGITGRTAIDAARTNTGPGRWVNDPKGTNKKANAEFVLHTPKGQPRQACVRTTRLIKNGEEILVKYGNQYWRFHLARMNRTQRARARTEQLSALLSSTLTSDLVQLLRAAAAADPHYSQLVQRRQPGCRVVDGLLLRPSGQVVVPSDASLRTRLLAEFHDSTTGAHLGRDKTLSALAARFEWTGMNGDVERYVSTCDACQRNKPSNQSTPGLLMPLPLPDRPCQAWTQDSVTGLPRTKRGHDAIQVYVERLCKLKHFAATRSTDGAAELASSFIHTVVRPHGVPETIVSDRDPRFTAHFYRELTRLMGTKLNMSTARHPQSDGQSEREIRTLVTALRAFCNAHQDDWDDYLDMLELGFNCTVQTSTQRSPYELLYGVVPRLPIDVALTPVTSNNPAAVDRAARMSKALQFARQQLQDAQQRQKDNADRHRRDDEFAVGDQVLLSVDGLRLHGHDNKLCSKYIGPFTITAVVNRNVYTLQLPPQLKALHPTFNIDKLKRYKDGTALFPDRPRQYNRPAPAAEADSNGDQQWQVERVVACRQRGSRRYYLVEWTGYPPEESTWEPASSLRGAADAVRQYHDRQLLD